MKLRTEWEAYLSIFAGELLPVRGPESVSMDARRLLEARSVKATWLCVSTLWESKLKGETYCSSIQSHIIVSVRLLEGADGDHTIVAGVARSSGHHRSIGASSDAHWRANARDSGKRRQDRFILFQVSHLLCVT